MATEQDRCPTKDYSELLQQRRESELRIVSKAWEDDAFREKLLKDPKATLARELGVELPKELTVKVRAESPTTAYLRIPSAPKRTTMSEELSEETLENVAGGGVIVAYESSGQSVAFIYNRNKQPGETSNWGLIIY
jgi:hypothetical protein